MLIKNILLADEISEILMNVDVIYNKEQLSSQNVVKFSIALPTSIKAKLENSLSIDLSKITHIPMRWIRGDTPPHIDRGESHFNSTYLMYLTDSVGSLYIDGSQYPIAAGDAHMFSEGLEHYTVDTGNSDRLMIGPMSESGFPVGGPGIYYYSDFSENKYISYSYVQPLNITIYGPTLAVPNDLSANFPNDASAYYIYVSDPPPDFTPPPGKVFGGWILAPSASYPILGGLSNAHIYMPSETYMFDNDNYSSHLVPNWIDIPISNVCFLANTPITTDQGIVAIDTIDPRIHTIRNKQIVAITQTLTRSTYLICFEKDSISHTIPSEKTVMSNNHLIFHKGMMIKAEDFIGKYNNIYKVKYNNEILYNVLLKDYDTIDVNNLICETLHPNNMIAKLYTLLPNYTAEQQRQIIAKYNRRMNMYYATSSKKSVQ